MRVCLISREYPPDTGWGGIGTFAKHLAHGLQEIGHDVEVVALAKDTDKARTVVTEGIVVHRVKPYKVPGDLGTFARAMPYSRYVLTTTTGLWKKFLERHNEKPFDVVDTPELLAEGLIPAFTKVAPLTIRLYTPHSKFISERLHNVRPSFDHELVAALERVAMVSADALTSPSEDLADYVSLDINYPREKIVIVRNPIDPQVFTPVGPSALSSDGKRTVLFVGRLEERKGIHYLVDAIPKVVAAVPNVRFVILGDDTKNGEGQKSVKAELMRSVQASGVESSITWIDRVPLETLPSYYRSADVCVVPSVYDNSPYTCLEAMSCGKPVIGTSAGGTSEYIGKDGAGVIVPPRDAEAIARELIRLLKDEKLRQQVGQNARNRVLDQFQRKEIARQTALVYEQAMARFVARQPFKLYQKNVDLALADTSVFLAASDKMLYDLLYQESIAFRVKHWWNMLKTRPKFYTVKAFVAVIKRISAGLHAKPPGVVDWLEKQLEIKQLAAKEEEIDEQVAGSVK